MANRVISALFDLDTNQFTVKLRDAVGRTKEFKQDLDALSRSAKVSATDLDGATRSLIAYATRQEQISRTTKELEQARNAFVISLKRELETMGMSKDTMLQYQAAGLGLLEQTREIRQAIAEKAATIEMAAAADREAAESTALLAREQLANEEAAHALTNSLREQIVTLRSGSDALIMERAALLGCEEETRALIGQIAILKKEHEEAALTMRAFGIGTKEMGHAAHGSRGALYELTVVMHELTGGRLRQAMSSSVILLQKLAVPLGVAAGFAIAATVALSMARSLGEAAKKYEDLARASQELGLSINTLQTLNAVSTMTGAKFDQLTGALGRMDMAFAKARMGSKQQKDAFAALNVDLKKNYTQTELLQAVLAKWKDIPDGMRKLTIATELFGRAGKEMIPTLNKLAEGWGKADAFAEKYGLHNDEAVKKGLAVADAFKETQVAASGLANTLMGLSGPAIVGILKGFDGMVQAFVAWTGNASNMRGVMEILKTGVVALTGFFGTLAVVGIGRAAIAMLGMSSQIIPALVMGFETLTAVMMANPWILVATGIALAAAALYHFGAAEDEAAKAGDALKKSQDLLKDAQDGVNKRTAEGIANSTIMAQKQLAEAEATLVNVKAKQLLAQQAKDQADRDYQASVRNGGGGRGLEAASGASVRTQAELDNRNKAVAEVQGTIDNDKKVLALNKTDKPAKLGTTAGDPFKVDKGKGDRGESLDSIIRAAKAKIAGASSLQFDDEDAGAKARAELRSKILSGGVKGISDPDSTKGKEALDLVQRAADMDDRATKSKEAFTSAAKAAAKAQEDANIAQRDAIAGGNPLQRQLDKANEGFDRQREILAKNLPFLVDSKKQLEEIARFDEMASKGKAANALKILADGLAQSNQDAAAAKDEGNGEPRWIDAAITRAQTLKNQQDLLKNLSGSALIQGSADVSKMSANNGDIDDKDAKKALQSATDAYDKIKESLMTVDQAREAAHQRELARINREFDLTVLKENLKGAALENALAARQKLMDGENEKFARDSETPAQTMARQWQDVTENMKQNQAGWMKDFVDKLTQGKLSFGDFAKEILMQTIETYFKAKIATMAQGLFDGIGGALSTGLSSLLSMGASVLGGGAPASMIGLGGFGTYHTGGIIGSEPTATKAYNASIFHGAPKYHTGGIAGLHPSEVPAILQKGEGVFTPGQMKALGSQSGGSAPPVMINLNNQSGVPLDGDHSATSFDGEKYIVDVVVSHLNKPGKLRNAVRSN
jgi:hypothetical protein